MEVTSLGVMLTLVGAAGIGFAIASQCQTLQRPDISVRPAWPAPPDALCHLLRRRGEPSGAMKRFIERVRAMTCSVGGLKLGSMMVRGANRGRSAGRGATVNG